MPLVQGSIALPLEIRQAIGGDAWGWALRVLVWMLENKWPDVDSCLFVKFGMPYASLLSTSPASVS